MWLTTCFALSSRLCLRLSRCFAARRVRSACSTRSLSAMRSARCRSRMQVRHTCIVHCAASSMCSSASSSLPSLELALVGLTLLLPAAGSLEALDTTGTYRNSSVLTCKRDPFVPTIRLRRVRACAVLASAPLPTLPLISRNGIALFLRTH